MKVLSLAVKAPVLRNKFVALAASRKAGAHVSKKGRRMDARR